MENKNSAILNVVTEPKEITFTVKDNPKEDRSSICSDSTLGYDNSLVQSPSIESFSSIRDIDNLAELTMDENSDLCVKIDNPEKNLETMETYITFRVTTRAARIEFSDHEYSVRRRYNDFLWLRQKLMECHPFCIVPPLPEKHSLMGQLDRYSKDFILARMKSLNVFISRICQHPILSCNENFHIFLTASTPDFNTYRKKKNSLSSSNSSLALNHPSSTHSILKNRHIEFDKMKVYLNILADKLTSIEKISSRVNKERVDLISELNNLYPIFLKWSQNEPRLRNILENIGKALERGAAAQSALVHDGYNNSMALPGKEFLQYIEVVQEALRRRESYQYNYEVSVDELNKRHSEKDKLLALSQNPTQVTNTGFSLWKQPSCDDQLEKLGTHIPQLVKKAESAQDNLEMANECLRSDLDCWQQEKRRCIKKWLLDFVNKQIYYYEANVNAWEHVTNELVSENAQAPSEPSNTK